MKVVLVKIGGELIKDSMFKCFGEKKKKRHRSVVVKISVQLVEKRRNSSAVKKHRWYFLSKSLFQICSALNSYMSTLSDCKIIFLILSGFLNCCLANFKQAVIRLLLRDGFHQPLYHLEMIDGVLFLLRDGCQQSSLCWRGHCWLPGNGRPFLFTGFDMTPISQQSLDYFSLFLFNNDTALRKNDIKNDKLSKHVSISSYWGSV